MRVILLALATSLACESRSHVQCLHEADCDLSSGGRCIAAASGNRWCAYPDPACPSGYRYSDLDVGDGVSGECVAVAMDGGVDAPVDVAIDADGSVTTGQFADLVIGQNDFLSDTANSGGQSASSLFGAMSAASDGTRLWIADARNARLLQFNALPVVNRPVANVIVGQAEATSSAPGTSQTTLRVGDLSAVAAGGKLFVVDGASNRVLIYGSLPAAHGAPASVVLGQASFTTSAGGKSASGLNGPADVWSDGTRLVVVDNANSRVLIWTSLPTTNGQAANIVLGRPGFGLGLGDPPADPPTSASMKFPVGVWSNGTRLYVADAGNHRVMVWNQFPTTSGQPCDFVIGQTAFSGNTPNAGGAIANAIGLHTPYRAVEANGSLFISDSMNHRVVVHTPIPSTSGEAADVVLGQDNLDSNDLPSIPTGNRMSSPRHIVATGGHLYVPDYQWNRVLRFELEP